MGIQSREYSTKVASQGQNYEKRGEKTVVKSSKNRNVALTENIAIDHRQTAAKKTTVYDPHGPRSSSETTHNIDSTKDSQSTNNNDLKINSFTIEPLAIFTFSGPEIKNLEASIYQAYIEDKLSLEFSSQLIKKVQQASPDAFKEIKSAVSSEITSCEYILELIDSLKTETETFDNALTERNKDSIDNFAKKNYELLVPDSMNETASFFESFDPETIIKKISKNPAIIDEKTNTSLVTQLLQMASFSMIHGMTPIICEDKLMFPNGQNNVDSSIFQGKESQ